ncbi:MAG: hypothetical protein KJ970_12360 [Candidatus Eisenbacteria bacterium]|uniref:Right handed beta helix domain-containing protein n=1 Tax=Eiseniibacteriota bacterium TaxID=2212470 RepID=A0A948RVN1_UNCEI|nr:hypothetical protein [Candidatus Eisenbacteria bacterium]
MVALISFGTLLVSSNSKATTWTVEWNPAQPENQIGAIAEIAASGDTILVGPGTYYEHIPLESKSLAFIGIEGKENTILDGSAIIEGREKSIIYMVGGDAEDLIVEGFTLRNGGGAPEEYGLISGGAISWWSRGLGGSATIQDCHFHDNYLLDDSSMGGGAVYLSDIFTVTMVGCVFDNNDADDVGGSAYIYNFEESIVKDCDFYIHSGSRAFGAALYSSGTGPISIIDCRFQGSGSCDGRTGLRVANLSATIKGNSFLDLDGPCATRIKLAPRLTVGDPHFSLIFTENHVWNSVGHTVGTDFQFWMNYSNSAIQFDHNTIVGTFVVFNSDHGNHPICSNNIFFESPVVASSSVGMHITCNNFWPDSLELTNPDNAFIEDNISLDPRFCDPELGDFHIAFQSPCAPGNSPEGCDLIGRLDPACDQTPTKNATWGSLKLLYRK